LFRPLLLALLAALLGAFACDDDSPPPANTPDRSTPPNASATLAAASATGTAIAVATRAPADVEPARILSRGDPSLRQVALTFDAGSDAGYTAVILETLRREGVRASFGITGLWAEQHKDLLLAIAADGHEIINHSYSHASFTGRSTEREPLTPEQRASELSRTETTVYRNTGRSTRPLFRPPFGDVDASVQGDAAANGYDVIVMWTVDTFGWRRASADEIVERGLRLAEPGAIYVMHVGSESEDGPALARLIAGLREMGYGFVTIGEMVR
jgi:peptidoglycan/xylan/chitin deacetylase (PgdA/CDA1 family)